MNPADVIETMSGVPNIPEAGFIRLSQILGKPKANPPLPAIIPVSKSTWWAGVKSGRYPAAVKLSERVTAWHAADIRALLGQIASNSIVATRTPHIRVTLTAEISAKLYANVTAYKLAMNQGAETDDALWSDDDVLIAALIRGIESLDATTQHLLRKVPA